MRPTSNWSGLVLLALAEDAALALGSVDAAVAER